MIRSRLLSNSTGVVMLKGRSITFKLVFYILLGTSVVLLLMSVYSYLFSTKIIRKQIRENAINLTHAVVNRIDAILLPIEKTPQSLALFLEHSRYDKNELLVLIREEVKNNPNIYGCTVAFAPYAFEADKLYFAPYYYRSNGKIKLKYIGSDSYRYFFWDWYQLPKELNRAIWSEPYYEKGGGAIMAAYSVPFYRVINGRKRFLGVVAVEVSLDWLQKMIASIKIGTTGYAFLISKDGRFITYPDKRFIMNETIFTVARECNYPYLKKIGMLMIHGNSGFVPVKSILTGKECWLSFAPLSSNGWSLGVMFPKKELMADIEKLNVHMVLLGLFGFGMLIVVVVFVSRSITRSLVALTEVTKDVAKGNLDIEIPYVHLNDEVGRLARSFEYMKSSLKEYIKNLKETTAAKERIESELNIASRIQSSMLPRTFPPFPEREEIDIYAVMQPAREVGGDFYDFFFIDKNKLCFLIGDVSGKGVPAALFMAIMKYLLKTDALRGLSPAEILKRVNGIIAPGNETCMFATVFVGILDVSNGELEFANAAHLPPVICDGGSVEFLGVKKGFVVGVMEKASFENQRTLLKKEQMLFLCTDGVTEAMNMDGELFGKERLIKVLSSTCRDNMNATDTIRKVMENIDMFVKSAPQADDITMLALLYRGRD